MNSQQVRAIAVEQGLELPEDDIEHISEVVSRIRSGLKHIRPNEAGQVEAPWALRKLTVGGCWGPETPE